MMRQLPTQTQKQAADRQHSFIEEEKRTVEKTIEAKIDNTFLNY
jgi:hypothetical protein